MSVSDLTSAHLGLSFAPQVCREILDALRLQPKSGPFNEPVDAIGLGLMDYFDIIRHPMDLGTIAARLNAGDYQQHAAVSAVSSDVELRSRGRRYLVLAKLQLLTFAPVLAFAPFLPFLFSASLSLSSLHRT